MNINVLNQIYKQPYVKKSEPKSTPRMNNSLKCDAVSFTGTWDNKEKVCLELCDLMKKVIEKRVQCRFKTEPIIKDVWTGVFNYGHDYERKLVGYRITSIDVGKTEIKLSKDEIEILGSDNVSVKNNRNKNIDLLLEALFDMIRINGLFAQSIRQNKYQSPWVLSHNAVYKPN